MVTIRKGSERATVASSVYQMIYKDLGWRIEASPERDKNLKSLTLESLKDLAAKAGLDVKGLKKDEIRALLEAQE